MKAELISVGTELLLGEIIDTNSAWLARDLARLGIDVYWSQRVGDNLNRLVHALRQALERSELIVCCGGLGPTDDDLTREAIAEVMGETPQVDADLEAELRTRFARFSRHMPEKNLKQAWLIPSAQALANPLGTAPGWLVRKDDKIIIALPGPPRELTRMWQEEVMPHLPLVDSALFIRTYKTHGLGESAIVERLGDLTLKANPSVATYARRDGVHVRIAAKAPGTEIARSLAEPLLKRVEETLGNHIWGADGDEWPQVICAKLRALGHSLATMESLTGGMLGQEITSVPGAAEVYQGGMVAYTAQAKAAFGVPKELLKAQGSISEGVALAMAQAAAYALGADYGLAVTGVAGPETLEDKPVGQVHLAFYSEGAQLAKTLQLPSLSRDMIRERAIFAALALLWSNLQR